MPNDLHADQWLDITDFSPGAYNHVNTAGITTTFPDDLPPAPTGSHDPSLTYSCLVLPAGGLAALPGIDATYTWTQPTTTGANWIVGFLLHDELLNGTTEVVVIWETDDGVNHNYSAFSYIVETTTFHNIVTTTNASSAGFFGSPYPQMTRMAPSNPTTTPGNPVIVWPSGPPAQPTGTTQVYVYPNPSAPSTFTPLTLISGSPGSQTSVAGQLIVHQSRVIIFAATNYTWPTGGGTLFFTNENINFTEPPNSTTLLNQNTVLAAEEPFGYGTSGSISAGEIFIVKRRGGGILVTGDVNSPNVTFLPGVQSTGIFYGRGDSGTSGFFYCSLGNGAWLWNGGNTSEKISQQLNDDFFLPKEFGTTFASNNYGFFIQCIGDKAYFSNNWLFDMRTKGWWKYYPDSHQGGIDFYYTQPAMGIESMTGPFIYAAPLQFPSASPTFMYRFNQSTPNQVFQWTSSPIMLTTEDRVMDIREVIVRISSVATNNSKITLSILDGGSTVFTEQGPFLGVGVSMQRWTVGVLGTTAPQIQVKVNNLTFPGDMPIVHSIHVRYKTRAHVGSVNA